MKKNSKSNRKYICFFQWFPRSSLSRVLWIGTLFHTFSFGSSSFVEEEHQTWYFLVMTFYTVAMVAEVKGYVTRTLQKDKISRDMGNFHKPWDKLANGGIYTQIVKLNKDGGHEPHVRQSTNNIQNNSRTSSNNVDQSLLCSDKVLPKQSIFSLSLFWLPWKQIGGIFLVMLLGRCMRTINQTGNKWLNTPDIADWLML